MNKPSSISYREFQTNLMNAINNSSLPAFVMIPLVQDTLRQLKQLEEQQYKIDVEEYNKSMSHQEIEEKQK